MGRPVWRDVLEQIQLGPAERAALLGSVTNERRRRHKLWGRIAAKEAARRLWHAAGKPPVYPADLAIRPTSTAGPLSFLWPMPPILPWRPSRSRTATESPSPLPRLIPRSVGIDVEHDRRAARGI